MTTDKHEVLLRMRAIELLAYWEGRLVTNRLMSWFGLSRQQASADIKRYNTLYNPDALVHDPSVKGYVPKATFQPVLTTVHINEYLNMLSGLVSESHIRLYRRLLTCSACDCSLMPVSISIPAKHCIKPMSRSCIDLIWPIAITAQPLNVPMWIS